MKQIVADVSQNVTSNLVCVSHRGKVIYWCSAFPWWEDVFLPFLLEGHHKDCSYCFLTVVCVLLPSRKTEAYCEVPASAKK